MSAIPQTLEARFEPMTATTLDAVLRIEQGAYTHPWTRGNFLDSLHAGYQAQVLLGGDDVLGYFVAMRGVDETHLLNITVNPSCQGQGWGRMMLEALAIWARGQGSQWLWLEVRQSNLRAQRIYEQFGFRKVGQRRGYYPAAAQQREDATVMSLRL